MMFRHHTIVDLLPPITFKIPLMDSRYMPVYQFEERVPQVPDSVWVAPEAVIVGDVKMGENCYVGPGAVIRGDYGSVVIGDGTSVEENVTIHARPDEVCTIGARVTLGHGAIIHNCTIKENAVVGMGSIVSDYATIGVWAVVAEGAVVKNNDTIPDEMIAVGIPAKPKAPVSDGYKEQWNHFKDIYVDLSRRYPEGLKRIR